MKVALLFYGQARNVDNPDISKCYHENIINKYDTDIFCHTWSDPEGNYPYSTWSNITRQTVPSNHLEHIKRNYNPVLLIDEKPIQFSLPEKTKEYIDSRFRGGHWIEHNYNNLMSQLYSIQRVSDYLYLSYVRGKSKHDFIVLARYDTILYNFPDLEKLDIDKFYLPNTHNGFPDMIKIFNPKFMSWSRNVFFDIADTYEGLIEPTPEEFKRLSFLKRFSEKDLCRIPMQAIAIR